MCKKHCSFPRIHNKCWETKAHSLMSYFKTIRRTFNETPWSQAFFLYLIHQVTVLKFHAVAHVNMMHEDHTWDIVLLLCVPHMYFEWWVLSHPVRNCGMKVDSLATDAWYISLLVNISLISQFYPFSSLPKEKKRKKKPFNLIQWEWFYLNMHYP